MYLPYVSLFLLSRQLEKTFVKKLEHIKKFML